MTADEGRVNVYALADPAVVASAQQQIGGSLRSVLGVTDAGLYLVTVSLTSAWLSFADRDRLWNTTRTPALPDATHARTAAEDFLRDLAARLAARRDLPDGVSGSSLLPRMRPTELSLLPRLDGAGGDHWLYRAQPVLPLGNRLGSADVLGAQVEVRIGDGGRVIALVSHWRPLSGERVTVPWRKFTPPTDHGHHDEQLAEPPHRPVYLLGGDGVPQYYLAPYHLVDTGHVLAVSSGSPWSLTVEFAVQPDPASGTARVTAVVDGGSGVYTFAWAWRPMDDPEHDGDLHELGAGEDRTLRAEDGHRYVGSTVTVPPGAHLVLLLVKDRRTGAFLHGQHMVCTGPALPARTDLVS